MRLGLRALRGIFRSSSGRLDNLGQPDEVVCDHSEGEGGGGSGDASDLEASDAADGLGPSECLFDTFADAQGYLVAIIARGAAVDQG